MIDNAPGISAQCEHCYAEQGFHLTTNSSQNTITIKCDDCGNVDVWEG